MPHTIASVGQVLVSVVLEEVEKLENSLVLSLDGRELRDVPALVTEGEGQAVVGLGDVTFDDGSVLVPSDRSGVNIHVVVAVSPVEGAVPGTSFSTPGLAAKAVS
jgi:hypothetical protein